MATVADIARAADVSIENVVRVLNRDPVDDDVRRRVTAALETLEVAAPARAPEAPAASPQGSVDETLDRVREQLVLALAHATAELEAAVPRGVEEAVHDALQAGVGPVAERVGAVDDRVARQGQAVEALLEEIRRERADRLADAALLVDLVTTSWRTVDERLGRIEELLAARPVPPAPAPMRALTLDA